MKRFTKVLIVVCLMLTVMLSAVACATSGTAGRDEEGRIIMLAPKVSLENNVAVWEGVRYAEKYRVEITTIDGDEEKVTEEDTTNTAYNIKAKYAKVRVKALGDNEDTVDSEWSNMVEYVAGDRLLTPDVSGEFNKDSGDLTITWNEIEGAEYYNVAISGVYSKTYTKITDTKLVIAKEDISSPGDYAIKVMADSSKANIIPSPYSNAYNHRTTVQLAAPNPTFDGGSIKWDQVSNAKSYEIWLQRGSEEKKLVFTETKLALDSSKIENAIERYNTDAEGNVGELSGVYTVYIKAVNRSNDQIYLDSSEVAVVNKENGEVQELNKVAAPADIYVQDGKLYWSKIDGYNNYEIEMKSGSMGSNRFDIDAGTLTEEAGKYSVQLNATEGEFTKLKPGLVYDHITVKVKADNAKGVLAGVAGESRNAYVGDVPELKPETGEDGKQYYAVSDIAGLVYMLANPDKDYKITANIDGEGANIYAGKGTLTGSVRAMRDKGANYSIGNFKLLPIEGETSVQLYDTIGESGVFEGVTIRDIKVEYETAVDVSIIANTNNGLVRDVYLLGSNAQNSNTVKTAGNIYGLVKTNNARIENVGVVGCSLISVGKATDDKTSRDNISVSGIVYENIGIIHNAMVSMSTIGIDIPADEKEDTEGEGENAESTVINRNLYVGGVALKNGGTLQYSMVYNARVYINYKNEGYNTTAYAGGLVTISNGAESKIEKSWVEGLINKNHTVSVHSDDYGKNTDYVGGLVGYVESGKVYVTNSYIANARLHGNKSIGGLIGYITGGGQATLTDSIMINMKVLGNKIDCIANAAENATVSCTNVYYNLSTDKEDNNTNAGSVYGNKIVRNDIEPYIKDGKLKGYVLTQGYAVNYPVLSDMVYVGAYFRGSNDGIPKIYYNGSEAVEGVAEYIEDTGKGVRVDKVIQTVNAGQDNEIKIIIPIYRASN